MTATIDTSNRAFDGRAVAKPDHEPWPSTPRARWAIRLALSLPYVVIALVADARGVSSEANDALVSGSRSIRWGSGDLDFVDQIYPPFPVALASALPGGSVVVGVAGALLAGVVLHVLAQRLVDREVPGWLVGVMVASVGAISGFVFLSTQDLARFMGVTLVIGAIAAMLRFAVDADTEGGFQSGLAFGVAVMCDPATAVFALFASVAALFVAFRRYRDSPGAASATLAVVLFPSVAAIAGWTFLEWRFTGGAFATVRAEPGFFDFTDGVATTVWRELRWVLRRVLESPVFLVTFGLLAWRRPIAVFVPVLMLSALAISGALGLGVGVGRAVVLIAGAGAMTVPARPGRTIQIVLAVAAVSQIAMGWLLIRPETPIDQFVQQFF